MDDDEQLDDELATYEDWGLEVRRIDGVPHARWDDRWLAIDTSEEPPRPKRTTLITATVDPGGGFMADEAYYELAKVDDTTLVRIERIDGIGTEVWLQDFEPGTEEAKIEDFIAQMRSMEPDTLVVGDDEDEEREGERTLRISRSD